MAQAIAIKGLMDQGALKQSPIEDHVAAISCGIFDGTPVADLDYAEDSNAGADANFVMTGAGNIVEVPATAEGAVFGRNELDRLMDLASAGIAELVVHQKAALEKA